jgi:hypothetical protein
LKWLLQLLGYPCPFFHAHWASMDISQWLLFIFLFWTS